MVIKIHYQFIGKIWKYEGPKGWYFVSLPSEMSQEIRNNHQCLEEGWGRLKSTIMIKDFQWDSSIWYDSKLKSYLLPLKADVRKKNQLEIDMIIEVGIWI